MEDRTIIQWDKSDIEALGILKIDLLALGMRSMVRRALELIAEKCGDPFELQVVPPEDPVTYDMLCDGDSMCVFQVESGAQMSMLSRLRPRCFYDLVIEVAIVRPGPVQGSMMHPFLRRRQGLEPVTFPSEGIEKALKRTLGVLIFRERVMQVAMLAAGFSAGEADQLRRTMAAWERRSPLSLHRHLQRTRQIQAISAARLTKTYEAWSAICLYRICAMNRKPLPGIAMQSAQKLREPASPNEQSPSRSRITRACYRREEVISVSHRLRNLPPPDPHARVNMVERQFSTLDQVN